MRYGFAVADATRLPFADRSFDMVVGSPPYGPRRCYGINAKRKTRTWVEWMLDVTAESLRVSRGLVVWVIGGWTVDGCYQPGPEGLLWEWQQRGLGECWRPVYWRKNGIPGSGNGVWYRADVEYCLAFKRKGPLPYAHPENNGHAPKYAPGGEMSYRLSDGKRVNQWGGSAKSGSVRRENGRRQKAGRQHHVTTTKRVADEPSYTPPKLANPGNSFYARVGGGHMGHALAHENEAPYPEAVPEWLLRGHCPPGGTVFDPFSGSGTTVAAAVKNGYSGFGTDLRRSQCELGVRRLRSITPGFTFDGTLEQKGA